MLANKEVNIPFCFSWANENWSRNWDGGNHEIIMRQEYGGREDWEKHLQYLLPFFSDERYITVDGKPLFLIYKPEQIIDIYQMAKYFRKRIREEGFPGICLAFQFPSYYADMYYRDDIFDYRVAFEPVYSRNENVKGAPGTDLRVKWFRKLLGEDLLSRYRKSKQSMIGSAWKKSTHLSKPSYDGLWDAILTNDWPKNLLPGAFVDWDNTPRNQNGVSYQGFSLEKFESNMRALLSRARDEHKPMVFINAWNEWGEGAYLEPDEHYGNARLETIRRIMIELNDETE